MRKSHITACLAGLLLPGVLIGPRVVAEYFGPGPYGIIDFVGFVSILLLSVTGVGSILALFWKNTRRSALMLLVFSGVSVGVGVGLLYLKEEARVLAFEQLAERSQPVVDAIWAYQRDIGGLPQSLSDLVPNYLQQVPRTDVPSSSHYDYETFESDNSSDERDVRWELSVRVQRFFLDYDTLVYWPTGSYPGVMGRHGWVTERFGDWALAQCC